MNLILLLIFTVAHASLPAYHDWMLGNGVEIHESVDLHSYEEAKAASIKSFVKNGTVLASVSSDIILNMKSIGQSPTLANVLDSKELEGRVTNVIKLAVFLLYSKHSVESESPWKSMIESFPNYGSSTSFWPQEDLVLLNGTTVYRRTVERLRGINSAYNLLLPHLTGTDVDGLIPTEQFTLPALLYCIQHIFSSSDSVKNERGETVPVLIPFIESLPRMPNSCCRLQARNNEAGTTSELILVATRDMQAGEELSVLSDHKTNYQMLLDHGTMDLQNKFNGIPFSFRFDVNDPHRVMKNQVLSMMGTSEFAEEIIMNTDNGAPPASLLRKLRIQMLDFQNFDSYRKIITSNEPLSLGNELRVLRTLWGATGSMLSSFSNQSLDYEIDLLKTFETDDNTPHPMTRPEVSGHIRYEEKSILFKLRIWIQKKWLSMLEIPFDEMVQLEDFRTLQTK